MAATRSPLVRLLHIRDEIEAVSGVVRDVTFEQYQTSYTLRRTVERAVQIVSEAAKALPMELCARYPEAPWSAIVGVGKSSDMNINAWTTAGCGISQHPISPSCYLSSSG